MTSGSDLSDTLEILKGQIELLMRKLDSSESGITAVLKKEEENNRILTSLMETLQQMGLLSQPYKKAEQKSHNGEDRAYW